MKELQTIILNKFMMLKNTLVRNPNKDNKETIKKFIADNKIPVFYTEDIKDILGERN